MAETSVHRRVFLRGLAAVLPTVLTIVIILWVFSLIQRYIGDYINYGSAWLYSKIYINAQDITNVVEAEKARTAIFIFWEKYLFWFGFVLALVAVYVIGRFLASYLGRWFWRGLEKGIMQLPLIRQIYPSVKQVTDFLFAERKVQYSKVVAVQYPRKGIWSLGLVTNPAMRSLNAEGEDWLTVFIPSSPTPITGYTITVRRDDVVDLPISIDEALRFTVSGGVIQPACESTGTLPAGPLNPSEASDEAPSSKGV